AKESEARQYVIDHANMPEAEKTESVTCWRRRQRTEPKAKTIMGVCAQAKKIENKITLRPERRLDIPG
ncbi:MAG: hypothetical protein KGI53_11075, partial [Nitrospirota bacterium]|nr:hypothetical protein [Nitrospirota bacterium]